MDVAPLLGDMGRPELEAAFTALGFHSSAEQLLRTSVQKLRLIVPSQLSDDSVHMFQVFFVKHRGITSPGRLQIRCVAQLRSEEIRQWALMTELEAVLLRLPGPRGSLGIASDPRGLTVGEMKRLVSACQVRISEVFDQTPNPPSLPSREREEPLRDEAQYATSDHSFGPARLAKVRACISLLGDVSGPTEHRLRGARVGILGGHQLAADVSRCLVEAGSQPVEIGGTMDDTAVLSCETLIVTHPNALNARRALRTSASQVVEGVHGATTPEAAVILENRAIDVLPSLLCNMEGPSTQADGNVLPVIEKARAMGVALKDIEFVKRTLKTSRTTAAWIVAVERLASST